MAWLISAALMTAYENSHSSPVQAGESSEGTSSDGEPSVPLSETPTPQAYLSPDRMRDFSRLSRSGMTFGLLTEDRGEDVLTWFLAAFPAKTSPQPGEVQELTGSGRDSGPKWPASLARYDRDSASWRTHQYSLLGGLIEFSETWPRWGTMRGGECWAQSMPERPTSVNGSGLWPTPATSDSKQRHTTKSTQRRLEIGKQIGLEAAVALAAQTEVWPTPNCEGYRSDGELILLAKKVTNPEEYVQMTHRAAQSKRDTAWMKIHQPDTTQSGNDATAATTGGATDINATPVTANVPTLTNLSDSVSIPMPHPWPKFPTPTAQDSKNNGAQSQQNRKTLPLNAMAGGALNPNWVEWLMGWPIGWTDLEPLGMDKFRLWLHSHGGF